MGVRSSIVNDHENFRKFSLDNKMEYFKKNMKFEKRRKEIFADIIGMTAHRDLPLQYTSICLDIMLEEALKDVDKLSKGYWPDDPLIYHMGKLVEYLPFSEKPYDTKRVEVFFEKIDDLVVCSDGLEDEEKKLNRFYVYAAFCSEMSKSLPDWSLPYNGTAVKIIGKVEEHFPSSAILPSDPKHAVANIEQFQSCTLFMEFNESFSAEERLNYLYGTDGIYGRHYQQLFECSKQYPYRVNTNSLESVCKSQSLNNLQF